MVESIRVTQIKNENNSNSNRIHCDMNDVRFADVYKATRDSSERIALKNKVGSNEVFIYKSNHSSLPSSIDHSIAYAPGSRGVYALRPVELTDSDAELQKLEELSKDIIEKGESGFFKKMDKQEAYAYLYNRYAEAFGPNFLDAQWQGYTLQRLPNESDQANSLILIEFQKHRRYVLFDLFDADKRAAWESRELSESEIASRRKTVADAFASYFGYGDMTPEERYQSILADYHASGDMSYAATFKTLWLLRETGAIDMETIDYATTLLKGKMDAEYAAQDMTVTDMAKSRYANAFYGFDAAAYLLGMMDYIQHAKETSIVFNYDSQTIAFFEKLTADLKALSGVHGIP